MRILPGCRGRRLAVEMGKTRRVEDVGDACRRAAENHPTGPQYDLRGIGAGETALRGRRQTDELRADFICGYLHGWCRGGRPPRAGRRMLRARRRGVADKPCLR